MNRLKDQRAPITGGTSGIGLETARKELGRDVLIIPTDASEVAAQKTLADTLRQAFGGLDILFANASIESGMGNL